MGTVVEVTSENVMCEHSKDIPRNIVKLDIELHLRCDASRIAKETASFLDDLNEFLEKRNGAKK